MKFHKNFVYNVKPFLKIYNDYDLHFFQGEQMLNGLDIVLGHSIPHLKTASAEMYLLIKAYR